MPRVRSSAKPVTSGRITRTSAKSGIRHDKAAPGNVPAPKRKVDKSKKENDDKREVVKEREEEAMDEENEEKEEGDETTDKYQNDPHKRRDSRGLSPSSHAYNEENGEGADNEDEDSFFEKQPQSYHGTNNNVKRDNLTYWVGTQRGRCALKKRIEEQPYSYLAQKKLRGCRHKHIKPRSKDGYEPFNDVISDIDTDDERRDGFVLVKEHKMENSSEMDSPDPIFGGPEAKKLRWGHN